uniref:Uncharacterized protein n=2 Tax=Lygus hesperus TaxID=30085 RepID=A0A146LE21_LYGHE
MDGEVGDVHFYCRQDIGGGVDADADVVADVVADVDVLENTQVDNPRRTSAHDTSNTVDTTVVSANGTVDTSTLSTGMLECYTTAIDGNKLAENPSDCCDDVHNILLDLHVHTPCELSAAVSNTSANNVVALDAVDGASETCITSGAVDGAPQSHPTLQGVSTDSQICNASNALLTTASELEVRSLSETTAPSINASTSMTTSKNATPTIHASDDIAMELMELSLDIGSPSSVDAVEVL